MNLVTEFLSYAKAERGFSRETIATYSKRLLNIAAWCEPRGFDWHTFTEDAARDFLAQFESEAYRGNFVIVIKSFYRWASEEKKLPDLGAKLSCPKRWKRIPKSLGNADIDLLLRQPADMGSPRAICDQAVLELAYASGLRLCELASVELNSVNLIEKFAVVTGKGNKQRVVPFGNTAQAALILWVEQGRPVVRKGNSPSNLFLNSYGRAFAKCTLWSRIKARARERGLPKVTPHVLRHTFSVHLLEGGANLRVIQELLGHASIATTECYTMISSGHIKAEWAKHPRAESEVDSEAYVAQNAACQNQSTEEGEVTASETCPA